MFNRLNCMTSNHSSITHFWEVFQITAIYLHQCLVCYEMTCSIFLFGKQHLIAMYGKKNIWSFHFLLLLQGIRNTTILHKHSRYEFSGCWKYFYAGMQQLSKLFNAIILYRFLLASGKFIAASKRITWEYYTRHFCNN